MRSHDEEMKCGDEGLDALVSAVARSAEPMPASSRAVVRERLLNTIAPAAVPLHVRVLRPAVAFATAAALLGGVSYAAAAAAPGEALFGLRQSVVATVRSAQTVLTSQPAERRVPAVLQPLEAPAVTPHISGPKIPQMREAAPKANEATRAAPGQSKAKGQGNGSATGNGNGNAGTKSSSPKGRGTGHKQNHRTTRGSKH